MARVPLLGQSDMSDDYQHLLSEEAMGEINLLCAMANNPSVLRSYMRYGTTLWKDGGLEAADVERCILTVARTLGVEYEWHQHVPIARDVGVPDADIRTISENELGNFDERLEAILRYVRAVADGTVDDDVYEAVSAHMDDSTLVGITQLATHYVATARFVNALQISTEDEFIGWTVDDD